MTSRGRTSPASTSGSFRAQAGERSRVAIDTDVELGFLDPYRTEAEQRLRDGYPYWKTNPDCGESSAAWYVVLKENHVPVEMMIATTADDEDHVWLSVNGHTFDPQPGTNPGVSYNNGRRHDPNEGWPSLEPYLRHSAEPDVALAAIAATYQHALNLWTGDEHDRLERAATNDLTEWIRQRPEAVATIDLAVERLTASGKAEHAAHANIIEAALTATDPETGMHPSTRKAMLRQALTETAENDNWTGARTIMATVIAARQHLAYHQQQTTDYQPPLHEIVSAVEHEPAFADLAGHTVPLAQAIRAHMHLRQQESGT